MFKKLLFCLFVTLNANQKIDIFSESKNESKKTNSSIFAKLKESKFTKFCAKNSTFIAIGIIVSTYLVLFVLHLKNQSLISYYELHLGHNYINDKLITKILFRISIGLSIVFLFFSTYKNFKVSKLKGILTLILTTIFLALFIRLNFSIRTGIHFTQAPATMFLNVPFDFARLFFNCEKLCNLINYIDN